MKPAWNPASTFDAPAYESVLVSDGVNEWIAFWWPSMRRMEPDRPFTLWRLAKPTPRWEDR